MRTLTLSLILGGLAWAQEAKLKPSETVNSSGLQKSMKGMLVDSTPIVSDTLKAEAWRVRSLIGIAESALRSTKEYKEFEKRQEEMQSQVAKLKALCGEKLQLSWEPEDIKCAPKPEPKKAEEKKK